LSIITANSRFSHLRQQGIEIASSWQIFSTLRETSIQLIAAQWYSLLFYHQSTLTGQSGYDNEPTCPSQSVLPENSLLYLRMNVQLYFDAAVEIILHLSWNHYCQVIIYSIATDRNVAMVQNIIYQLCPVEE